MTPFQDNNDAGLDNLADRELEILTLISNGLSNNEIADRLFIGINTVKTHIRLAYAKINVSSRSEAVIWGARHGLLDGYDPPTE